MKIAGLVAATLLGVATPALAQYAPPPYDMAPRPYAPMPPRADMLPPQEAMTVIRSMGLEPISRPVLRGRVYVVRSVDEDGIAVSAIVDARSGMVLQVVEAGPYAPPQGWRAARGDAYMASPESIPPGLIPPESVPPGTMRPPIGSVIRPAPAPKVATRAPLPRPAPPHAKPATPGGGLAALPDPKAKPGKSVPAPVASRPKDSTAAANAPAPQTNASEAAHESPVVTGSTPASPTQTAPANELKLVPVAPLE
jgi:hypothetical protein